MEGKNDGCRKETNKGIQQARAAVAGFGAADGVLGDCDSDVLAVNPLRRRVGARRIAGLEDAGFGNSMRERKAR
jgi:hypothetical protein